MGFGPSIVFYDQWKSDSACPSDMHDDWHVSGVVTSVVGNHDTVVTFVVDCDICRGKDATFVVSCDICRGKVVTFVVGCDICRGKVVTFVVGCDICRGKVVTFVVGCDICRGKVVTFVVGCDICRGNVVTFVVGCDFCRGLLWHLSGAVTFSGIVTFVGTTHENRKMTRYNSVIKKRSNVYCPSFSSLITLNEIVGMHWNTVICI